MKTLQKFSGLAVGCASLRALRLVLASLALGAFLSACGGGGGGGSSTKSSSSKSSSSVSSAASSSSSTASLGADQFTNPLFGNGADPWMQYYKGNYYLVTTTGTSQLVMRKSPTIAGLKTATPQVIWSDTTASRCCNFWAFEFHLLSGPHGQRWYLMYTAGDAGGFGNQKLQVLESAGDDPLGPYEFKATLMPDRWNIDGSYFVTDSQLYLLWSQFVGADQSLMIAKMDNPWTVDFSSIRQLSKPELSWELEVERVNEGPEVLKHNGRTFVTYSTNLCHSPNYQLGMLELIGADPLQPTSWVKNPEPVFSAANGVYGPGHNGFFKSPDGSQDWLVYHGNALSTDGCGPTRSVRVQPFTYDTNGTPDFGAPVAAGAPVNAPSGESGPIQTQVQGVKYQLVNAGNNQCLSRNGDGTLTTKDCAAATDSWVMESTADGWYRFNNTVAQDFLSVESCAESPSDAVKNSAWFTSGCQQWGLSADANGLLTIKNHISNQYLTIDNCAVAIDPLVGAAASADPVCSSWYLAPVAEVAVVNINSGKVMEVADCASDAGANIRQWEWNASACQRWQFKRVEDGFFELHPQHNPDACALLTGNTLALGANIAQGACGGIESQWRFEPLADGSFRIVARASNKVVDVDGCRLNNGGNLAQWDWLNNNCQRFMLRSTGDIGVQPREESFLYPLTGDLITHDPTLTSENGIWYEFQTGAGMPRKKSTDGGITWQDIAPMFTQGLSWWATYVPANDGMDVWAPDVEIYNGKVWLYYSISTFGSIRSAIGLMSATSLAADDWQDEGLVINTTSSNDYNAIDPNLVIDAADEPWLVFGSWWSGIKLTKLDKTTMKPTGSLFSLASRDGGIEGASLTYHNGYYYLFISVNGCCNGVFSTYQIRYGRSASITGPYLDKDGTSMLNSGGSLLWGGSSRWIGPGGQDIDRASVISFHAYDAWDNGTPKLRIANLLWDANGWPALE